MVFGARVLDVSLGTLRIIFIARGRRKLAPLLGFFEVLIWIVVVSQVIQNLHSPLAFIAYAAGFATGNYVGMRIEDKLAIGTLVVRVIVPQEASQLMAQLHDAGYGVTSIDARGSTGRGHLNLHRRQAQRPLRCDDHYPEHLSQGFHLCGRSALDTRRHFPGAHTPLSRSAGAAQGDVGAGRAIGALRRVNSDRNLFQNLHPATKGAQPGQRSTGSTT